MGWGGVFRVLVFLLVFGFFAGFCVADGGDRDERPEGSVVHHPEVVVGEASSGGLGGGVSPPMYVGVQATGTSGNLSAALSWTKPVMPFGYPASANPVVYAYQNVTVSGSVRNLRSSAVNVTVNVTLVNASSNTVKSVLMLNNRTQLSAVGGANESKTLAVIASENNGSVVWNTGYQTGEYYFMLTVNNGTHSFSVNTSSDRFQIGYTLTADFDTTRTIGTAFSVGDAVRLNSSAEINNTGNQVINGSLIIQVWKWDNDSSAWNAEAGYPVRLVNGTAINVSLGGRYNLVGNVGSVSWTVPSGAEDGTYRLVVAINGSNGSVMNQVVGASVVGSMENQMPTIGVEKVVSPNPVETGNQTALVSWRIQPTGNPARDAGIFNVGGGQAGLAKLDLVFVVDTSGSMDHIWNGTVQIMEELIEYFSQDSDVRHSVFALSYYVDPFYNYTVNNVTYSIVKLNRGAFSHSPGYTNTVSVETLFYDDAEDGGGWLFYNASNVTTEDYSSGLRSFKIGTNFSAQPKMQTIEPVCLCTNATVVVFNDTAENGSSRWTLSGFNLTESSSSNSWRYNSSNHSYGTNVTNSTMTMVNAVNLSGLSHARLSFHTYGYYYTVLNVDVSDNGGLNWTRIGNVTDYNTMDTTIWFDLHNYTGRSILVRFTRGAPTSQNDYFVGYQYIDDVVIDDSFCPTNVTLRFHTKYNLTKGDYAYVYASTDNYSWYSVTSISDSSTNINSGWISYAGDLTDYTGQCIYLQFRGYTTNASRIDTWFVDNINITNEFYRDLFYAEDWGPGAEYLAESHPWREGSIRVVFPISDEGPYDGGTEYGGTWDPIFSSEDNQSITDAIAASNAHSVLQYPMYGSGYYNWTETLWVKGQMDTLADGTGGRVAHWNDTETAKDIISANIAEEIKIAGRDLVINARIRNQTNYSQMNFSSCTVNGRSITIPTSKKTVDGNYVNVTLDKTFISEIISISALPPEEVTVSCNTTLPLMSAGESRTLTDAENYTYTDAIKGTTNVGNISAGTVESTSDVTVLILFDMQRYLDLGYNTTLVNSLQNALQQYAAAANGTIYNLSSYRQWWEQNHSRSAYDGVYENASPFEATADGRWRWNGYPTNLKSKIHSLAIDTNTQNILIVGADNVVPYLRIADPVGWELSDDYRYTTGGAHGILWSDFPYSDLNGDDYPDVPVARLVGDPNLIITVLNNSMEQHVSSTNRTLIAYKWEDAERRAIHRNMTLHVRNFWSTNASEYPEGNPAGGNSITAVTVGGRTFLQRLSDDNNLIYVGTHGNDFRDAGEATQEYSDDHGGVVLDPADISAAISHPFFITKACHGGVSYPDDDEATSNVWALLDSGAVGFVGGTGYSPSLAGAQFYAGRFIPLLRNQSVGRAFINAKRDLYQTFGTGADAKYYKLMLQISELYGVPTYRLYIPADASPSPTPQYGAAYAGIAGAGTGYNITTNTSGGNTTIRITIAPLTVSTINDTEGELCNLTSIDGASLAGSSTTPVVPLIVETVELSDTEDVESLLSTVTAVVETHTNITLPVANEMPGIITNATSYNCTTLNLSGTYPSNMVEHEVIEAVNGSKTVVFRIYPVTYNESARTVTLARNITFGFVQETVQPQMAKIVVSKIVGSDYVSIGLQNLGPTKAVGITVTEQLPANVSATTISDGGVYNSSSRTVTWTVISLDASGSGSFKTLSFVPRASEIGNYTLNTSVSYSSEGGTSYAPATSSGSAEITSSQTVDIALRTGWNLVSIPLEIA